MSDVPMETPYEKNLEDSLYDRDAPHPLADLTARPGLPKLTQSSKWSCIPTAFAMVLSKDDHSKAGQLLANIMEQLGRDDERGFHVQELLGIAITLGWAFSPFDAEPELDRAPCGHCRSGKVERKLFNQSDTATFDCPICEGTGLKTRAPMVLWPLMNILFNQDGVLLGKRLGATNYHAAAWCCETQQVLDPEEGVYDLERFEVMTFWAGFRLGT